jgi:soluble lytic murein transglycosylase-like protein
MNRRQIITGVIGSFLFALTAVPMAQEPAAARQYQRALTREARALWGLDAPIAVMAGQIHQESAWNADAKSAYAGGLAQFTPATADWISGAYPKDLGERQPFNPAWAIRALVRYDFDLYGKQGIVPNACDRWAFALSGYNGGPGWIARDRKRCISSSGCDPKLWFGHVELHSPRSAAAFKENREYPKRILTRHQAIYARWGGTIACSIP